MPEYIVHISPKDGSSEGTTIDLETYDITDLYKETDKLFPSSAPQSYFCPKCGCCAYPDEDHDYVCHCGCIIFSDEVKRDLLFEVPEDNYYSGLLKNYGYVTEDKIHPCFNDFINAFGSVDGSEKEDSLIAYLDNMTFNASKHDIDDVIKGFKEDYIGYAKTSDEESTMAWYGEYLVENEIVEIPEHLEHCVDYADLARDYFIGGDVWSSDGHIFRSR